MSPLPPPPQEISTLQGKKPQMISVLQQQDKLVARKTEEPSHVGKLVPQCCPRAPSPAEGVTLGSHSFPVNRQAYSPKDLRNCRVWAG